MVQLNKHEPQELRLDDAEESKSTRSQVSSPAMAGREPQSLVMQEPPLLADASMHSPDLVLAPERRMLLRRDPQFRALQSQVARLQIENEELRRQLGRERRGDQCMPAELKWLIYFRAPAEGQARDLKARVLAIVREGLVTLFAKDPSFRTRECATFWAAQEHPNWQAFRIDYVGFKLAAFRAAMKAAHADAQVPAN